MATTVNQFNGMAYSSGYAGEALTGGRFVNFTAKDVFGIADTAEGVAGIVAESADDGANATVFYSGEGLLDVDATAAILINSRLKPAADSSGKGIVTTTDADEYGAIALEPLASGTGTIRVLITPHSTLAG